MESTMDNPLEAETVNSLQMVVNKEKADEETTRLFKTLLINLSFFGAMGITEGIKGPTLLDLKDIYETSIEVISFRFLIGSLGQLVGSFFTGYIMDRYPHHWNAVMFCNHVVLALLTTIIPFCGHIYILFAVVFVYGFSFAGMDTGGNIMILHIWRGKKGGPSMHSVHFSWSVGAFLAPLLAVPFLSTKATLERHLELNGTNISDIDTALKNLGTKGDTNITQLYPMLGIIPLVISFGFLYYELADKKRRHQTPRINNSTNNMSNTNQNWTISLISIISVMVVFYFMYAGIELALAVYMTPFAVECKLHMTRVQGASITATFWGCFAAMRFFVIFAAMKVSPLVIMVFSFVLCLVGGVSLVFFAETSVLLLEVSVGILGVGCASVYATGFLWLEQYMVITTKIVALFIIAGSLGPDVFPVVMGQFIEVWPMFWAYLTFGTVVACLLLFMLASYLGSRMEEERRERDGVERVEEVVPMVQNGKH